jgi:hypothetical protein
MTISKEDDPLLILETERTAQWGKHCINHPIKRWRGRPMAEFRGFRTYKVDIEIS